MHNECGVKLLQAVKVKACLTVDYLHDFQYNCCLKKTNFKDKKASLKFKRTGDKQK